MAEAVSPRQWTFLGVHYRIWAFTAVLAVWAVGLVIHQHGGIGACLAVLLMVIPVLVARRSPVGAAAFLIPAVAVNEVFFGHLVRCGPGLPAAFFIVYLAAAARPEWVRWAALASVLVSIEIQCVYDPRLGAAEILVMGPTAALFFVSGVVVRIRSDNTRRLRQGNTALRMQRERTAALAVATDAERIRADLVAGISAEIHMIRALSDPSGPPAGDADSTLAEIERRGRGALDRMREVVGAMRLSATQPEPGLDDVEALVRTTTSCQVDLHVTGETRPLPASIELSGYRIVERLLSSLADDPDARAQVVLTYRSDALEVTVTGPLASESTEFEQRAGQLAGIRDRVFLHGGTLDLTEPNGILSARIRLPLVSHYV